MPPPPPRFPLFPPDLALTLSRATRRAFRARAEGALDDVDDADRAAFAEALFTRAFPASFADLLDDVLAFGDEHARDALLEGALDRGVDVSRWLALPAIDLGARIAIRARERGGRWKRIEARGRVRLGRRFARRAWYDARLLAAALPSPRDLVALAARRVHGEGLRRVFEADTEDGARWYAIVHLGPAVRTARWDEGPIRARVQRAPTCDLVRWDAVGGRISFSLARPHQLTEWKEALAAAGGGPVLSARLPLTLKPFHERGAIFLGGITLPAPVRSVDVVACELDDGTRFTVRGPNALAVMHARLGHGGYVYRATLRFVLDGAPRPVDVTIELPDKVLVSEPRWEPAIRAALVALGLTEPGAIADDLASLAPFVHPEWRWSDLVSAAVLAAAVARGFFTRVRTRKAGGLRHRVWGSMYTAHDLDGETAQYAVADDPASRAHTITREALSHLRLDLGALARALQVDLALEPPAVADPPKEVLPIGTLVTKSARLVFFLLVAVVTEAECAALREAIRRACVRGQTPVVLVGCGRTLYGGIAEVEVSVGEQLGAPSVVRVVAAAAEAMKLEDEISAWRWAAPDAPLVFLRDAREAWLGRVKLDLTAGQLAAIDVLALAGTAWTTPLELGKVLSPRATWHDQIARKTLADLDARIERSFADAGVELPEAWRGAVVEMKKGKGYRMGVGVVVR